MTTIEKFVFSLYLGHIHCTIRFPVVLAQNKKKDKQNTHSFACSISELILLVLLLVAVDEEMGAML
jgi:hypothetical protein